MLNENVNQNIAKAILDMNQGVDWMWRQHFNPDKEKAKGIAADEQRMVNEAQKLFVREFYKEFPQQKTVITFESGVQYKFVALKFSAQGCIYKLLFEKISNGKAPIVLQISADSENPFYYIDVLELENDKLVAGADKLIKSMVRYDNRLQSTKNYYTNLKENTYLKKNKNRERMTTKEKQALITLLEAKIERETGKKVKYMDPKIDQVKMIHEKLEQLTGKKVFYVNESKATAEQKYLSKGLISEEDFNFLLEADPTPTKKYVEWMCKMFTNNEANTSQLKSAIQEFNVFVQRGGRVENKDINSYATFQDLQKLLDELNANKTASAKELERDFEVVVDNDKIYIAAPHTWEASRKLGLSKFAVRQNPHTGTQDSAWCTTYATRAHFDDYYHGKNLTFYYILLRGSLLKQAVKEFDKNIQAVAITVAPNGNVEGWDQTDQQMKDAKLSKYLKLIEPAIENINL